MARIVFQPNELQNGIISPKKKTDRVSLPTEKTNLLKSKTPMSKVTYIRSSLKTVIYLGCIYNRFPENDDESWDIAKGAVNQLGLDLKRKGKCQPQDQLRL